MGRRQRILAENYKAVRYNIFALCRAMNFKPTHQQNKLLELVQRREPRIACKSGQGPGKTTVSVVVGIWRALQRESSLVIVTAPTMRQCKDIWLAEARRLMKKADPWLQRFVKVQSTKIQIAGQRDWGVMTMTATNEEAAQGFHEKNLSVIAEEASGIPRSLITQFKGTLSNPNALFLMIGNPNTRDCAFYDCFNRQRHKWASITFNAEETPESEWFDPQRNADLEEEFGRESDVYKVRVLGEFPSSDPNCVLSSEDLEKITDRKLMLPMAALSRIKQFGIDLARFGSDESTVYRRSGESIVQWKRYAKIDPSIVIDEAFRWQLECGWKNDDCLYVPDAGGIGQGIMHKFYNAFKNIHEFHNGGCSSQPERYANKVTEAWFGVARKTRKQAMYLPNDQNLLQQLCSRQYFMNKKGQLVLESKEEYKKRGHDSPDRADGCVMAMFDGHTEDDAVMELDMAQRQIGIR